MTPLAPAAAGGDAGFAVEPTAIGPQSLVPGVAPISARDRLAWRAAAPLEPKKAQRPCNHGLFDLNARNQLDLFSSLPPTPDDGAAAGGPTSALR